MASRLKWKPFIANPQSPAVIRTDRMRQTTRISPHLLTLAILIALGCSTQQDSKDTLAAIAYTRDHGTDADAAHAYSRLVDYIGKNRTTLDDIGDHLGIPTRGSHGVYCFYTTTGSHAFSLTLADGTIDWCQLDSLEPMDCPSGRCFQATKVKSWFENESRWHATHDHGG